MNTRDQQIVYNLTGHKQNADAWAGLAEKKRIATTESTCIMLYENKNKGDYIHGTKIQSK